MKFQHSAWAQGTFVAVIASAMLATSSSAQDVPPKVNIWLNPDARFVTWETRDQITGETTSKGHQVYVPFGGKMAMRFADDVKISLVARSGYVSTKNTINTTVLGEPAALTGEVATLTDSSVSATAVFYKIPGIQPYISMGVNIPTGQTKLSAAERRALVDSDIVQIASYGQGVNLAPTIGANIPLNSDWLLSVSAGYSNRGAFERNRLSKVAPYGDVITTIDPGDSLTGDATLGYQSGPLSASLTGSYSADGASTFDGVPYFKSGHSVSAGLSVDYTLSPNWVVSTSVSYSQSKRNTFRTGESAHTYRLEDFNSNNAVTRFAVDPTYTEGAWSFGPTFAYTYRDHNSWDPKKFEFVAAKTIISLGAAAQYTVSDKLAVSARASRSWLDENRAPASQSPALSTDVWLFTLGGTLSF
jgi:outer membrane protein W